MCTTPFKWLLIGLMVISFAGRALAFAPAPTMQRCAGLSAVAMESTSSAATHDAGKIRADETAVPKTDPAEPMTADCAKICAAAPILGASVMSWYSDVWPQVHSAAIETALNGRSLKPELSPPIALV